MRTGSRDPLGAAAAAGWMSGILFMMLVDALAYTRVAWWIRGVVLLLCVVVVVPLYYLLKLIIRGRL